MSRAPLHVIVTWDDACDRAVHAVWDGTFETAARIAEVAPLYYERQTTGFLVLVDAEALWLAHDYDREESEVSNFTVIPLGWVTKVAAGRRVLYRREL